jgi:hypothetical protein
MTATKRDFQCSFVVKFKVMADQNIEPVQNLRHHENQPPTRMDIMEMGTTRRRRDVVYSARE